jgi:hypothetical protein
MTIPNATPVSPGQHVPHFDDKVYGNRPVSVWNQAQCLAVQL